MNIYLLALNFTVQVLFFSFSFGQQFSFAFSSLPDLIIISISLPFPGGGDSDIAKGAFLTSLLEKGKNVSVCPEVKQRIF